MEAVQCGPMNKFEQVSSDGHQMSLAGVWDQGFPCYMSGGPHVQCLHGEKVGRYSEVQCIITFTIESHLIFALNWSIYLFTARKRSLGLQGNIFSRTWVKNSVHKGGGEYLGRYTPLAGTPPGR